MTLALIGKCCQKWNRGQLSLVLLLLLNIQQGSPVLLCPIDGSMKPVKLKKQRVCVCVCAPGKAEFFGERKAQLKNVGMTP